MLDAEWAVRGTSRTSAGVAAIEAAGIEGAEADPDRLGTVLDLIDDVTAIVWLMGSASGSEEAVAAANGDRLESLMIRLVDTPVRGFVYEGVGSAPSGVLRRGAGIVEDAAERWRIPVRILREERGRDGWTDATAEAVRSAIG